jgi:acetyl-CoA carboxylase biotin carboxylase subunit
MIAIALGEAITFRRDDLARRGHAIECRIYAEDPYHGFAPSPGTVRHLRLPAGPGVRNDVGIETGSVVPIDYDPMLGKLVVSGPDRQGAIRRLARALSEYEVSGVATTLPLFRALVSDEDFVEGRFDVQWLDRRLGEGFLRAQPAGPDEALLGAVALASGLQTPAFSAPGPGGNGSAWRRAARVESLRNGPR